jgi:predicted dienelactone hydrolase
VLRVLRWLILVLLAVVASAAIALSCAPDPAARGPVSRELLAAGPHAVTQRTLQLVDRSRGSPASADRPAQAWRSLPTTVWLPEAGDERFPLLVYSHGFGGDPHENRRLLAHLASRGFAVAAVEFPRTSRLGGTPDIADLAHQPADVRFVIDSLLGGTESERIDAERIGVIGLSLGGLTTELVAFHRELRDPRVRVAVVIAGPTSMFTARFFETAPVPLLMLAGTGDAIVDYAANARDLLRLVPHAALVSLDGGTHLGFADAARLFRWLPHPDSVACAFVRDTAPNEPSFLEPLGGAENGIVIGPGELPCRTPLDGPTMRPPLQQLLTRAATTAFVEAHLTREDSPHDKLAALAREYPRELSIRLTDD